MSPEAASVMLVDDHPLFRKGLQHQIKFMLNTLKKLGVRSRVEAALWIINQEKSV